MADALIDRARAGHGDPERTIDASATATPAPAPGPHVDGVATRDAWVAMAQRLATPVLDHLAAGQLRARMPVEQLPGHDRSRVSPLEAVARLLAGIAPWL